MAKKHKNVIDFDCLVEQVFDRVVEKMETSAPILTLNQELEIARLNTLVANKENERVRTAAVLEEIRLIVDRDCERNGKEIVKAVVSLVEERDNLRKVLLLKSLEESLGSGTSLEDLIENELNCDDCEERENCTRFKSDEE